MVYHCLKLACLRTCRMLTVIEEGKLHSQGQFCAARDLPVTCAFKCC